MNAIEQGTVASYDPDSRSGVVVDDQGRGSRFDASAFDAGGARHFRFGQRVRIERDEAGVITLVTILTL